MSPDLRVQFVDAPAVVRLKELRLEAERKRKVLRKDEESDESTSQQDGEESEECHAAEPPPEPVVGKEPAGGSGLATVLLDEESTADRLGRRPAPEWVHLQGRFEDLVRKIESEVLRVERRLHEEFAALESEVVKLAIAIAGKVIGREIESGGVGFANLIGEGIGKVAAGLHEPTRITVRVAKKDRQMLEEVLGDRIDSPERVRIEEDSGLAPSSCLVFCDMRQVSIDLEKELCRIREALLGGDENDG